MPGTASPAPPALGTATPVTESLAKPGMQKLCPAGVLQMNRNGKSSLRHTAKPCIFIYLFFPRLQSAERRATCPISVGLSDFSQSDSSFTCFRTIFTQLTFHGLSVVGGRASFSTFSFISFCYQTCWLTDLHIHIFR